MGIQAMTQDQNLELQDAAVLEQAVATEATSAMTGWEKLRQHILSFIQLEDNWDGEGTPKSALI